MIFTMDTQLLGAMHKKALRVSSDEDFEVAACFLIPDVTTFCRGRRPERASDPWDQV